MGGLALVRLRGTRPSWQRNVGYNEYNAHWSASKCRRQLSICKLCRSQKECIAYKEIAAYVTLTDCDAKKAK